MNHEPLTRDHGFPIRVIVPGYAGARSVKWLDTITVQAEEANNFYMKRDYKVLPKDVTSRERQDIDDIWSSVPALQDMGVQSAICWPMNGDTVISSDGGFDLKGYAVAGEDGPIKAVHISTNEGESWINADIIYQEGKYSWTIWKCRVFGIDESSKIWSQSQTASGRLQPIQPIWNLRGIMANGVSEITGIRLCSI